VIFIDVENTSNETALVRVVEHLQIDRVQQDTELIAVGNWKSVGARAARRLAAFGARLLHSAPSPGVRDWSDLAIAVAAGQRLATARPGDVLEIVSDDRAFDAVGDAAAAAGIVFHRLSHRTVTAAPAAETTPAPRSRRRGRRGRGGKQPAKATTVAGAEAAVTKAAPSTAPARNSRRRSRRGRGKAPVAPAATKAAATRPSRSPATTDEEAHAASHDKIIAALERLSKATGSTTIDALANALRGESFQRPSGSPRLITRLRRLKDVEVSASGQVRLVAPQETLAQPPEAGQ
jgi:hypothetical protein